MTDCVTDARPVGRAAHRIPPTLDDERSDAGDGITAGTRAWEDGPRSRAIPVFT